MKLKNRFIILIAGVFIIPVFIASLGILLYAPRYLETSFGMVGNKEFTKQVDSAESITDLISIFETLPQGLFSYIFDSNGEMVYHEGAPFIDTSLVNETRQHFVFSRTLELPDKHIYSLLIGREDYEFFMPLTGFIIMGSIFFFLSILSFLTIRSINNSIKNLEKGTKRIADGDLDTPIVIKGDDTFVSLANSFEIMRQKVKEEQDRQMRFFMGVSHDLKTPLSSITGYAEALLDGMACDSQAQEKYLHIIHAKGKLLEQRISRLIEYMKLSNNAFREALQERTLVPFLRDFVDLQQDEAALQNYTFEADIAIDEDVCIAFDPELLSRAMENLLQNCIRYGLLSKPIHMFCKYSDEGICLGFSNYYLQPLSSQLSQHMFEPFFRGDQARKGEGTGLGLASVRSIVEGHGWEVRGYSNVDEETTIFEILIPLYTTQNC